MSSGRGRQASGSRAHRGVGAVGVLALVVLVGGAGSARAQSGTVDRRGQADIGEHVASWRTAVAIQPDGSLLVHETIAWDFGDAPHHGIIRDIPTHFPYDEVKKGWDRVTPIDHVTVTATDASASFKKSQAGDDTVIKIGSSDHTVTGEHTYDIRYRMRGVLNHFADHDELYLNIIGLGAMTVPVDRTVGFIALPGKITRRACYAGLALSRLPCDSTAATDRTATFHQDGLQPGQAFTVVVGFARGTVHVPPPILLQRWSFQNAFSLRSDTVGPAVGLSGLALVLFLAVAWKVGRDRQFAGSATDQAFGGEGVGERAVPLGGGDKSPVQFEPPDHLRPGEIGTLIDEQANTLDVTATIIDLAVNGYLRIEEIETHHLFHKTDWKLVDTGKDISELLSYERKLHASLFASRKEVELSALKNTFATKLAAVEKMMYTDVVAKGWFAKSPEKTRAMWKKIGTGILVAGLVLTGLLAWRTTYGLLGLPLVFAGLLVREGNGVFPRRTAKGKAILIRTLGFKQFIDESEKDRAQFAEKAHLFTEYLPYAVVFGATEKWARAFEGLEGQLPQQDWYISQHPFTVVAFSHSLGGFTTATAGTISSTPAGSGSSGFGGGGFSGGGFGGGGASSW
ncbi:MAG TPA: DUF2207 domain-containing protein [Acidimicrobiales bacterium]